MVSFKLFFSRQISQLPTIPEITWNEKGHIKKNCSIQHYQPHVLGTVGTPYNLYTTTAIPILLSDSQNSTHNFATKKQW